MSNPIDLTRGSGLITEGMHLFKILEAKEGASKDNGNPLWVVEMECQDGDDDKGKKITKWISLLPQARFSLDNFLDAIEAPAHGEMLVEQCNGKLLKAYITHEEYNGAPSQNIWRMFPTSFNKEVTPPAKKEEKASSTPELNTQSSRRPTF